MPVCVCECMCEYIIVIFLHMYVDLMHSVRANAVTLTLQLSCLQKAACSRVRQVQHSIEGIPLNQPLPLFLENGGFILTQPHLHTQ